jgi:hypothetical protein
MHCKPGKKQLLLHKHLADRKARRGREVQLVSEAKQQCPSGHHGLLLVGGRLLGYHGTNVGGELHSACKLTAFVVCLRAIHGPGIWILMQQHQQPLVGSISHQSL